MCRGDCTSILKRHGTVMVPYCRIWSNGTVAPLRRRSHRKKRFLHPHLGPADRPILLREMERSSGDQSLYPRKNLFCARLHHYGRTAEAAEWIECATLLAEAHPRDLRSCSPCPASHGSACRGSRPARQGWGSMEEGRRLTALRSSTTSSGRSRRMRPKGKLPPAPFLLQSLLNWRRETPYASPTDWVFPVLG
jgi:hypothetical protein